ncbi:MAG TPA: glycerol-3-phosphate acyltransferase [Ktedonobacterales bacterium]|nr:glycerol-3-phosphate acyltransferase [Ktedonobacterales bacterium]
MDQQDLVAIICAYLIGSIPFSQIITYWRTGLKLREVGEGNVGSRNVWHVVGPSWGIAAGILDCSKGFLVCRIASAFFPLAVAALAGIAVVLGHQFSLFLRGRGGKGLASALGVVLAFSPLSALGGLLVLGLAYLLLRDFNPSVAITIVALILLPILLREPLWVSGYTLGLSLLAALKKQFDRSHETLTWNAHPWQGAATPGGQRPVHQASEDATSPDAQPH